MSRSENGRGKPYNASDEESDKKNQPADDPCEFPNTSGQSAEHQNQSDNHQGEPVPSETSPQLVDKEKPTMASQELPFPLNTMFRPESFSPLFSLWAKTSISVMEQIEELQSQMVERWKKATEQRHSLIREGVDHLSAITAKTNRALREQLGRLVMS